MVALNEIVTADGCDTIWWSNYGTRQKEGVNALKHIHLNSCTFAFGPKNFNLKQFSIAGNNQFLATV